MRYQGTDIDGPRVDPDQLMVRDIDLVEIMGNKTFLECLFLTLYDKFPSEDQLAELNRFFNDGFRSIDSNDPLFRIIPEIATSPSYSLNALIAGLTIDREQQIKQIRVPDLDVPVTEVALAGFYFMSILPIISGFAAAYPVENKTGLLERLEKAKALEGDYVDRIAYFLRGKPFTHPREKKLLESILVAFCAGFGYLTPSIMSPRISIGSGVSVGLAIIAGCTTAGPWHLGTSQDVIIMFQELQKQRRERPLEAYVTSFLNDKFEGGKKLLGFGHPFFKKIQEYSG